MNVLSLIFKYYPEDTQLRRLLLLHSRLVARKALEIAAGLQDNSIDTQFIEEAAMLHDIGIFRCKAPGIFCNGDLPYIRHGIEGARILEAEGLKWHALVCERHTGSGLTAEEIESKGLPLPHRNMLPLTAEEKIICGADKFYSKSGDPTREKSLDEITHEMGRFGSGSLQRWLQLEKELRLRKEL